MNTCKECGMVAGAPHWHAKTHILWANQYGTGTRVFCNCGVWTDWRKIYKTGEMTGKIVYRKPPEGRLSPASQALMDNLRERMKNITGGE